MKKLKHSASLFILTITFFLASCAGKEMPKTTYKIEVRYIEQICCGNLMTLGNQIVSSTCETYQDSLLRAINLDEFGIAQNNQFGDILTIEYQLTEACEASCELTCNRMNGIPIKLFSVE
jgi:hypothetical protein